MILKSALNTAILIAGMTLISHAAFASPSSLNEQEVPTLQEGNLADVIKKGNCIVMYYTADFPKKAEDSLAIYNMSNQQIGDQLMRGMIALGTKAGASVKFYKVNWKTFSPAAITNIQFNVGSVYKQPESPSFAAYARGGRIAYQARGMQRPDTLAWFTNEMMSEFVPTVRSKQDEYLRIGWTITDVNSKFVHLRDMRDETRQLNGKPVEVRVTGYGSDLNSEYSCEYEQLHLKNGTLIGAVETYGPYGKVEYYDYDGNGKLQYRVKTPAVMKEAPAH